MKHFYPLLLLFILCVTSNAQTITVQGKAFFDNNRNALFDAGDSAYKQAYIDVKGLFNFSAVTDQNGNYTITVQPGVYSISLRNMFDQRFYHATTAFSKIYEIGESDVSDIINFPIIKRPAVESLGISVFNANGAPTGSASTMRYQIISGYKGLEESMPAKIVFQYDSLATLISTSLPPAFQTNSRIEWTIPNLPSYSQNIINVDLHLPAMGDTITQLTHHVNLNLHKDSIDKNSSSSLEEQIKFPVKPIGNTKGVKWLRNFTPFGDYYNYFLSGVDTATGGREYFVTGEKQTTDEDFETGESFIAKLNDGGLTIWERNLSDYVDDGSKYIAYNVIHSDDGGCLVGGCFTTGIDEVHGDTELTDLLILKFDKNGNLDWKKYLGGTRSDGSVTGIMGMVESLDGGLIISGETYSQDGDFTNSNPDTLHSNVYVTKLSSEGNVVWSKVLGGSHDESCIRLKALSNGGFVLLASTSSKDGDVKGAHNHRLMDTQWDYFGRDSIFAPEAWILQFDVNGNLVWSKCFGGTNSSYITGVVENNNGLLFAGYTNSKDGDLSHYDSRYLPIWLVQTNHSGQILWQKQYPEHSGYKNQPLPDFHYYFNHSYSGLYKKPDGSVVIAGNIADKYGAIKAKHGSEDIFIANLSPVGDLLWQKAIGGTAEEFLTEICVDRKGDIIVAGGSLSPDDDLYGHHADVASIVAKVGVSNIITGKVFIDLNANHVPDSNEPLIGDGGIRSFYNGDTAFANIENGYFQSNVDTGVFVSRYVNANSYFSSFPDSAISIFTSYEQGDSILFALVPKAEISDLDVSIIPLTTTRPGFNVSYKVITKNIGTKPINNVIVKLAKTSAVNFLNANRIATEVTADTISFQPLNLAIGALDELIINCKLATPPGLNNGDTITLTAVAFPLMADTTPTNNQSSLKAIARGSFDPNDKSEAHAGIYTPAMKANAEPFQYMVRFQNTGSDTAFYVTVKDTLDSRLDLQSLETVSSSHPYQFTIEDKIITWQFDMIKLVDSTTDNDKSHGYISFRIKPNDELQVGDSVLNKAAIYFDYNLPIITNTALVAVMIPACPVGNNWTGAISTAWENPANWSCAVVPDANTDVYIKSSAVRQPEVSGITAVCRSIVADTNAHVWVKVGAKLEITGK